MSQERPDTFISSLLDDNVDRTVVLNQPTMSAFNAEANKAQPFKMTGLLDHFELYQGLKLHATDHQQCKFLSGLSPNEKINYTIMPPKNRSYFGNSDDGSLNFSFLGNSTNLASFCHLLIDYINNPSLGTLYFQARPIKALCRQMSRLVILNDTYSLQRRPNFWIGHAQKLSLHNDPYRNIIGMFCGIKKVTLFPPNLPISCLYPTLLQHTAGLLNSQVNPYEFDPDKFPQFRDAISASVTVYIHPGEVLYIPPLWWHACESNHFNVGFNYWFYSNKQHGKAIDGFLDSYYEVRRKLDPATSVAERDRLYNALLSGIASIEHNQPVDLELGSSTSVARAILKIIQSLQDLYNCNPPYLTEFHNYKIFFSEMLRTFELTNSNQPYNAFPDVTYHQMRSDVIKSIGRGASPLARLNSRMRCFLKRTLFSRIL